MSKNFRSFSEKNYIIEHNSSVKKYIPCIKLGLTKPLNNNKYFIKMKSLEESLKKTKDCMEPLIKKHSRYFKSVTSNFESFKQARMHISGRFNTPSVSNSWIMIYEILHEFKLIPKDTRSKSWTHFNSENLPCSTILPVYHYINTICDDSMVSAYKWMTAFPMNSSLYKGEDLYNMASRNQANVLTDFKTNINNVYDNITNVEYIDQVCLQKSIKCDEPVNIFTGSLVREIGKDYNNEEFINNKTFLAQLYLCFRVLSKGGSAIIKNYTFFTVFNISMIAFIRNHFKELHIYKPESSKTDNSVIYFVCKGFSGVNDNNMKYMRNVLLDKSFNFRNDAIFPIIKINEEFWKELCGACEMIVERQKKCIINNIANFEKLARKKHIINYNGSINYSKLQSESRNIFRKKIDRDNENWYRKYRIYVLHKNRWPNIKNITVARTHVEHHKKRTYIKR